MRFVHNGNIKIEDPFRLTETESIQFRVNHINQSRRPFTSNVTQLGRTLSHLFCRIDGFCPRVPSCTCSPSSDIRSWYDSANMRPIRTSSPFLLSGLVLSFMIITKVSAQICPYDPNIEISFPEHDPTGSATPGNSDPQFRQQIPITGQPFSVTIGPDTTKPNSFPFDEYFTYGYNSVLGSYYVVMTKGIDRDGATAIVDDDTNIRQYQLMCQETSGSPVLYSILKIQIMDVNDNTPQFQNAPYTFSVNELTPIGLTVFRQISATDRDEGANRQIEYSLSDSQGAQFAGSSYFTLQALPLTAEGFVSVAQLLDFESMYGATNCDPAQLYYNITVTARDCGTPSLSSTTTMIIRILDGDDLGPGFVYPSCVPSPEQCDNSCKRPKYRSSIPSGTNEDTALVFTPEPVDASNPGGTVDIVMQDKDTLGAAVDCDVAFTIPAGYESYFRAVSTPLSGKQYKCEVTYTVPSGQQPLNRNSLPELELVIEATEQTSNRRQDFATIIIILTETSSSNNSCECGQLAITASSSTGYIYENSPARTFVAGDPVVNKALQLTFTGPSVSPSNPSSGIDISWSEGTPFAVNPYGFVYLATSTLDYETTPLYLLTVTITERTPERRTATTDLTINVLDVVCND